MSLSQEHCGWFQDMLGTKAPKRSPIVLRMVMLAFAAVFGVYSCFICLRQIRTHVDLKDIPLYTNVQLNVEHCQISGIQPKESLYLHFPEPKAYSRYHWNVYTFFRLVYDLSGKIVDISTGMNAFAILSTSLQFCPCRDLEVDGLKRY